MSEDDNEEQPLILHLKHQSSVYRHVCGLMGSATREYTELLVGADGLVCLSFIGPGSFGIPLETLPEAELHYKGEELEVCMVCVEGAKRLSNG